MYRTSRIEEVKWDSIANPSSISDRVYQRMQSGRHYCRSDPYGCL